jgi:hypothetical protein
MTDWQQGKGKEKARLLKGRQRAEGRRQKAEGSVLLSDSDPS